MNINIYYGGRGLIGDPTQYVIKKMCEVLEELKKYMINPVESREAKLDLFDTLDIKYDIPTEVAAVS